MTPTDRPRGERRRGGFDPGSVEGHAEILLRLLHVKFGKVPAHIAARIKAAEAATLTRWTERLLTAPTLAKVLDG